MIEYLIKNYKKIMFFTFYIILIIFISALYKNNSLIWRREIFTFLVTFLYVFNISSDIENLMDSTRIVREKNRIKLVLRANIANFKTASIFSIIYIIAIRINHIFEIKRHITGTMGEYTSNFFISSLLKLLAQVPGWLILGELTIALFFLFKSRVLAIILTWGIVIITEGVQEKIAFLGIKKYIYSIYHNMFLGSDIGLKNFTLLEGFESILKNCMLFFVILAITCIILKRTDFLKRSLE